MVTRAQSQAQFNHVCDNLFRRGDGSLLKRALVQEGFDNVITLASIADDMVPLLSYTKNDVATVITKGDMGHVRTFSKFVAHRIAAGEDVATGWLTVTGEQYDAFRVTTITAELANTTVTNPGPAGTVGQNRSAVETFRKSIKLDPSVYPILKDKKLNDTWHRTMLSWARSQGVEQVFDPDYVPNTPEEWALFREMQKYVYAVLELVLRTDRGKAFIRKHEDDFDAQKVYAKVLAYHKTSTKAQINLSNTLTYITSAKLGTAEWQGSTEGFILHWQNQLRLHDRLVETGDRITDSVRKTLLENAVHPIAELRQVKTSAALQQTLTGRPLTYEEYCTLLLLVAASYDAQIQAKRGKRQVLMHDSSFMEQYEDQFGYDDQDYDIDVPVDVIQANAMNRARSRPGGGPPNPASRLPPEVYKSLATADQSTWRQISEAGRATIVAPMTPAAGGNQTSPNAANLQANVHDMTDSDTTNTPTAGDQPDGDSKVGDEDTNVLVNAATTGGRLPPGDIRRVMSKASVRNVSMADITYDVSPPQPFLTPSLVDRGANGGVGGSDVRIIHQDLHVVELRGIDGHRVGEIATGTVGGVIETEEGPIVAVFHQYALLGRGPSIHSSAQMEHNQNEVNDRSIHAGGLQRIQTASGHVIPLSIHNGLPRLAVRPFTDDEWKTLPHITMTSKSKWDPSVMDYTTVEVGPTANIFLPSPPTRLVNVTELICWEMSKANIGEPN